MSSAASENQPKKKRRIDKSDDPKPGPSNEVLPLVAPHLLRKSSRDPNRGMYPRTRARSNQESSCPEFETASSIYKRSSQRHKNSKAVANKINSSVKKSTSSETQPISSKEEEDFVENGRKLDSNVVIAKRSRRSRTSSDDSANKITKYFKYSNRKRTVMRKTVKSPPNDPPPAEWAVKNEELAQCLDRNERFFKNFDVCYGLVESPVKEETDLASKLPNHIVEYIVCQIPIKDMDSCRLVCRHWRDVIDDDGFMKWKKYYYKYKAESATSVIRVQTDLQKIICSYGHKNVGSCIEAIVRYMSDGFHKRPSADMFILLMKNPKGEIADQVMSERFSHWEQKESRIWCQFAIAILICESAWEIFGVYRALFNAKSDCSLPVVLDAMYCIATFLLFFRNVDNINYGLHYRLFFVLNLIDNYIPSSQRDAVKIVKGIPGQQNMHGYSSTDNSFSHLTVEQIRILNHRFQLHQKIRILALAGTGKTTTLMNLAKLYPQIAFLNIVFNKALSDDAKKHFPCNVTCQTAHSLAYASIGRFLRHKLTTKIRAFDVGAEHMKHITSATAHYSYANMMLVTINNFVSSISSEISMHHVPLRDSCDKRIGDSTRDGVLKDVRLLWEKMICKDNPAKITHDVYLKLFQLRRPKFQRFQCIMVDEAQDCNPAMLDIVLSQDVPVILVGDPHQQIYAFRGAINALDMMTYTHTYCLTKSFRFGPEISYVASCLLECFKPSSRNFCIVGCEKDSIINGESQGQLAIISRTNVTLFNEAVRIVVNGDLKPHEPEVVTAAFIGGIKNYGFEQMIDIWKLRAGTVEKVSGIKDKFIARFRDFKELSRYATQADDSDLQTKIDLVNQHGHNICKIVAILTEKCNSPVNLATVVFSTAHKAKGLEFETVSLTDDFPFNVDHSQHLFLGLSNLEDTHVMYVALTRAKKSLILPEKLLKILLIAHEKFEYPVSAKKTVGSVKVLKCYSCSQDFTPRTVLLMMKRKMVLASGREIAGGPLCMKCGSDPYMRPEVHVNNIIMLLDPTRDNGHSFMNSIAGPLPGDPKIRYQSHNYDEEARIFVINVNFHV